MSFALVWKFAGRDAGESEPGSPARILIGHPGTFSSTDSEAKEEGRRILADDQIEEEHRKALSPLAVVEVDEDLGDDIQERCEEVEIGTELLFYDLADFPRWHNHPWWPRV